MAGATRLYKDSRQLPKRSKQGPLEILSGWKDIANYMRKGVRTVQRYELELGLPVRRPVGAPTGSVMATKPEIDAWISASPVRKAFRIAYRAQDNTEIRKKLRQQLTELQQLQEQAVQLRQEMSTGAGRWRNRYTWCRKG
jgi:hypothetical protein